MPTLSPAAAGDVVIGEPARRPAGSRSLALLLGAFTGLLSLTAMARLAAGAFSGPMSRFAWVVVLAAMVPWVVYVAWRARHGRVAGARLVLVAALVAIGGGVVWLSVVGPVLALACSLAASVIIWVSDWPVRRSRGNDRLVTIEELQRDEEE